MRPQRKPLQLLFTSVLVAALAGFASPALAIDADDFAAKLSASHDVFGNRFSYGSATANGTNVTLGSVNQEMPGQPDISLGDLTFEGVNETDDGGYTVARVGYNDISVTQSDADISITGLVLSGIRIPGAADGNQSNQMMSYERARSGPISVTIDGNGVFSIAEFESAMTRQPGNNGIDIVAKANGVIIDLQAIDAIRGRQKMSILGFDKLRGNLNLDMSWEFESGRVQMRDYAFTIADLGRLTMQFDISGYTPEILKAMQQTGAAAASNPDPLAAQQAAGFAMMGMMQQLTFNGGSIRFDDASATGKALAYAGRKQGVSGEQMAQAIKGLLPLAMWRLNLPALQQQISAAVNTYLDNPGNITISANPRSPVALPSIMGAGMRAQMGDPGTLVDLLNVQVTANDPVELCCKE